MLYLEACRQVLPAENIAKDCHKNMSASNNRDKEYFTYHHLMSRIAHKVYFLTDEVRSDFLEMVRRAAEFCGIKLLAWCVMTNHFHLLAYLPEPEAIDEPEVLRRYGILKGKARRTELEKELEMLRHAKDGEEEVRKRLETIKRIMYDIGEFMKIVKQWMTQDYNRRYSHSGTLWESVYRDVTVKGTAEELGKRAAYIHLNPIRAAICGGFAEYPWSSFTALRRGDELALEGMRLIYGSEAGREEILSAHHELMSDLLEQIKFERAQDIARKRQAGFDVPPDPLTTEALIAQAASHLETVMAASVEEKAIKRSRGRPAQAADLESAIRRLLAQDPQMSAGAIVEATGRSESLVYRCLKKIRAK